MIITKARTEPLTLDLLNALLANFATGLITCDELWAQIESCGDDCEEPSYCEDFGCVFQTDIPDVIRNRISGLDSGAGI